MKILSIETSCDETAISIVQANQQVDNFKVISDLVISQVETHVEYGGVFPALAKREHAKNLTPLLRAAMEGDQGEKQKAILDESTRRGVQKILEREPKVYEALVGFFEENPVVKIDMVMVTHGPGLAPALWVGVNFARALSILFNCPIMPVNHMEGHITSILLRENYRDEERALYPIADFKFPMIALLISGGHTQIVLVKDWCDYKILGETIDDAVGEAFDKVARMLGMSYPGGPKISKAAENGRENGEIELPRPMLHSNDYRFSFSGLKTATRYLVEELRGSGKFNEQITSDIAREFEHSVTDVLLKKTMDAVEEYGAQGLIIGGGVSANKFISENFQKKTEEYGIPLYLPERKMCGDNSLMIATAGFMNLRKNKTATLPAGAEMVAVGNLKL